MPIYHVRRSYSAKPDAALADFSLKVVGHLTDNVNFPAPPVSLVQLTAAANAFKNATAALAVGRMAVRAKNAARDALIALLDQLATAVERTSQNNPAVMSSAGFGMADSDPSSPMPVGTPVIQGITSTGPGKLSFKFAPADNSWAIELQTNSTPGAGIGTEFFTHPGAAQLDGLTSGKRYSFRARAHGPGNQKSAWSKPVSYLAT